MDPQTYDNRIRLGTGLACLAGLEAIKTRLSEVTLPFKVLHETSDDITWYKGSQRLFEEARSTDKEIKLYPGENHILLKVGRDDAEDAKRQAVIDDMLDWLDRH
jgi:acylglycerol lipase